MKGFYENIFILFFAACILPFSAVGQILNVEKSRIDKDTFNIFLGNISLSFNMFNRNTGNTTASNFLGFQGAGDIAYISKKHNYMWINNFNYVMLKNEPIVQTGYSHFRINFWRKRRISYEVFSQYQYDIGRGLEQRWLAGNGLRLAILRKKTINLFLGVGGMYEFEEWVTPGTQHGPIQVYFLKSSNYLSTRVKLNENFEFNSIFYYQFVYDKDIDALRNRLSGDLNLLFKVTSNLRFRTSFWCNYDNRPIVPVTPFIFSITNGVQYNF